MSIKWLVKCLMLFFLVLINVLFKVYMFIGIGTITCYSMCLPEDGYIGLLQCMCKCVWSEPVNVTMVSIYNHCST